MRLVLLSKLRETLLNCEYVSSESSRASRLYTSRSCSAELLQDCVCVGVCVCGGGGGGVVQHNM